MESINQFLRHRNMRRVNKRQIAGGSDCPKFALTCDNNPTTTAAPAASATSVAPAPDSSTSVAPTSTVAPASTSPTSTSASPSPTSTSTTSSSAAPATTPATTSSTTASSETSSSTTSSSSTTPSSTAPASVAVAPSSTASARASVTAAAAAAGTQTAVVVLQTSAASVAASSASSSSTPSANSGTSTGVIVGGVAAAAVGVIGLLIAIWYFVRKCRNTDDEAFDWNADQARRQSRMIEDDVLSSEPTAPSMFAPTAGSMRPPTMIERHVNNASPMLARQLSMGAGAYGQQEYGTVDYGAYGNNNMGYQATAEEYAYLPPHNAFSSPYAQAPMGSPVSSTVPSYNTYGDEPPSAPTPALMRGPSMGQGAMIHRAPSQSQSAQVTRNPSQMSPSGEDYADLNRSSVTPFQAQTYAEIHDRLGPVAEEPRVPDAAAIPGVAAAARSQNAGTPLPEYQNAVPRGNPANHNDSKRPDTVYSAMYDDEDAYGGM